MAENFPIIHITKKEPLNIEKRIKIERKIQIYEKDKVFIPIFKKDVPIESIKSINESRGIAIIKRDQIKEIVEGPLVHACEMFWDKNIKTFESSANANDLNTGLAYITIHYDSLSQENKEVVRDLGFEPYEETFNDGNVVRLNFEIKKDDTAQEISKKAVDIASRFAPQKLTWVTGTTLDEQIEWLNMRYGNDQATAEEIERLKTPGAWKEQCEKHESYFDDETQTSWPSAELFLKVRGFDEKITPSIDITPKITIFKKINITKKE